MSIPAIHLTLGSIYYVMLCLQFANAARNPKVDALLKDLRGQVRPRKNRWFTLKTELSEFMRVFGGSRGGYL